MRIAGIVAEYNPFHNGHAYHIERTRAEDGGGATHVVAVMSGSFVQRGEPALFSKTDRVRMALAGGVDLVLELPLPWVLSSAEGFARGAVSLLDALRCVDLLSFGSEEGELAPLQKAVDRMEDSRFNALLRYRMEGGIPYSKARQMVLSELAGERTAALLDHPNNTLGIEYLRALRALNGTMTPFTVRRRGAEHDAMRPLDNTASATFLRVLLSSGRLMDALPYMPSSCGKVCEEAFSAGRAPASPERLERAILSTLRRMTPEEFSALPTMSEGLENRTYTAVRQAGSLEELWELLKTKRYPMTRLRRAVYAAFLGIRAEDAADLPPYIRPLGATERGLEILGAAKAAGCTLPILSRASRAKTLDARGTRIWELECAAADQYALSMPTPLPCGAEYTSGMQKEAVSSD